MQSIEDVFNGSRFTPASVQRDYQWTAANCETLLDDLRDALDRPADDASVGTPSAGSVVIDPSPTSLLPGTFVDDGGDDGEPSGTILVPALVPPLSPPLTVYFLGAMVFSAAPQSTDQPGSAQRFDIFDGLQRLTTLTVLIAVLRDLVVDDALRARLAALVVDAGTGPRLVIRRGNRILLQEIHGAGAAKVERRLRRGLDETELRIRATAKYFLGRLKTMATPRLEAFADSLLRSTFIAVHEIDDARLARQVFVTTNLHGLRLNRCDLFKGQLMDLMPDAAAADTLLSAWDIVAREVGDTLDGFLQAIDFIERRERQGVDCLTRLASQLERTRTPEQIVDWVVAMKLTAVAWRQLHEKMQTLDARPIDAHIWKLRFFWWPEWKPLALLWYRDYLDQRDAQGRPWSSSWKRFCRRFEALHGRCLAIVLADYSPADRAVIFRNAIAQSSTSNPLHKALAFYPDEIAKMRRSLLTPLTDDAKRKTTVRWIEAAMWGDGMPSQLKSMQVEHVLPLNPHPDSNWYGTFPDDEDRYDAAHSLGNLACLDAERNRDIGNAEYAVKIEAYGLDPQFKTIQQVAASTFWNGDMIRAREKLLVDFVFAEMALPILDPTDRR